MNSLPRAAVCAVVAFIVSACGGGVDAPPKVAPPAVAAALKPLESIDISTPDKAIKAYWTQRDAINAGLPEVRTTMRGQLDGLIRGMRVVTTSAMVADERLGNPPPEAFERDIVEVKVESESRAVVLAVIKNVTPIPVGADISAREEKQRREGDRYRYVLEREKEGWKVAEIWERDILDRTPWRKAMPLDRKPYVQTDTYQGR